MSRSADFAGRALRERSMLRPMTQAPLGWAAMIALLTGASGCGGSCDTRSLPPSDPCAGRDCCDTITVVPLPDGGVRVVPDGADAGAPTQTRFCGACNG